MKPNTFKHWNITLKILIESFGIERKLMERKYFIFMEKKKMKRKISLKKISVSFLIVSCGII